MNTKWLPERIRNLSDQNLSALIESGYDAVDMMPRKLKLFIILLSMLEDEKRRRESHEPENAMQ